MSLHLFYLADARKACHTHSPKAGQGMNVSMMDSYNLAWKLIYSLNDSLHNHKEPLINYLTPTRWNVNLLPTINCLRQGVSSMFSGKIGTESDKENLTNKQILEVFSTGNGFTSGCEIEYLENLLVDKSGSETVIQGKDFLNGILRPWRRLRNVKVKWHADGARRDIQDGTLANFSCQSSSNLGTPDFPSTGHFRILCCTSIDLLPTTGACASALNAISSLLGLLLPGAIDLAALHPLPSNSFTGLEFQTWCKTIQR